MFPIRDHNPSHRTPWVTWALIVLNTTIFLAQVPIMSDDAALSSFFGRWALVPAEVTQGIDTHGILTSMFLHAGWMHLIGNMLFLWIYGDNLEDQLGHVRYLLFYLACGAAAAFAHVAADPASPIPTVGASGAIAGVMGGYLLLFPRARIDILFIFIVFFRVISVPAWLVLGFWFALQVFSGATTPTEGGGVAFWAHAGGFVAGLAFVLPLWLCRGGPGFWSANHGMPPHPEAEYSASTVPLVRRRR
jgi:membrane associated rhomboid family serine protease